MNLLQSHVRLCMCMSRGAHRALCRNAPQVEERVDGGKAKIATKFEPLQIWA